MRRHKTVAPNMKEEIEPYMRTRRTTVAVSWDLSHPNHNDKIYIIESHMIKPEQLFLTGVRKNPKVSVRQFQAVWRLVSPLERMASGRVEQYTVSRSGVLSWVCLG